jgi:hypothetical protein
LYKYYIKDFKKNQILRLHQGKSYGLGRIRFPNIRLPLRPHCNPLARQPRQFLRPLATLLGYCTFGTSEWNRTTDLSGHIKSTYLQRTSFAI